MSACSAPVPALHRPAGQRAVRQTQSSVDLVSSLLAAPAFLLFLLTVCHPRSGLGAPVYIEQSGQPSSQGLQGSFSQPLMPDVVPLDSGDGRRVPIENDGEGLISSGDELYDQSSEDPEEESQSYIDSAIADSHILDTTSARDENAPVAYSGAPTASADEDDRANLDEPQIHSVPIEPDDNAVIALESRAEAEEQSEEDNPFSSAPSAAEAPASAPAPAPASGPMQQLPSTASAPELAPGPVASGPSPAEEALDDAWADDWFADFHPALYREAQLGVLPANITQGASKQQREILTLAFYPSYKNIMRNFSGTLLGPVNSAAGSKGNESAPVYLEDVLGALLNAAQHRAATRRGPRQQGTPIASRSLMGGAAKGSADEVMYDVVGVTPGAVYSMSMDAAASGVATAGVAFYDSMWRPLEAPSFKVAGRKIQTYAISMVAPKEAQLALVFAGSIPSRAVPDSGAAVVGIRSVAFGPAMAGAVRVDFRSRVRVVPATAVGLNLNYMLDGPARLGAGPGLANTLKDIGMRSLRYPGGEKADGMLWNGSPGGVSPDPQPSRRGNGDWPFSDSVLYNAGNSSWVETPLTFDEYLGLADQLSADPYVVLNYDSANKQDGSKSSTLEQLKQAAAQWVRYALEQSKRVKFWEFSNESYFKAYNGYATASQYANELVSWGKTLRQIDPDMAIGANGPSNRNGVSEVDAFGQRWWPLVLQTAGSSIDFVICHSYPVTGWTYDYYQRNTLNFQNDVQEVDAAIQTWAAAADNQRLRIAVTEFGVLDFRGVWQNSRADLGHALVAFDMLASLLSHPRVDVALFWNTRWKAGGGGGPSNPGSTVYTVYDDNTPTALGAVIKVYANFFPGSTVLTTASTQTVRTWAMLPGPGSAWSLTVVLLNKASTPTDQVVQVDNYAGNAVGRAGQFGGTSEVDTSPQWSLIARGPIIDHGFFNLTLAPYSITVITF